VYLDSMGFETVTVLCCSGTVFAVAAAVFAAGWVESECRRGGRGGANGGE
jgi:hypothetical protein